MSDPDTLQSIALRVRELTQENEKLFRELHLAERRYRALSRSAWRVEEDERRRLARELHDGVGQILTALKLQLEGARQNGSKQPPEAIDERIDGALAMATQALNDTRELSRLLRPAVLDDLGLDPALRWLARTIRERFAIEVELRLSGLDERFDRELETLVFRIVQEALTNVAKHSGATNARVEIDATKEWLKIRISDTGRGFVLPSLSDADGGSSGIGLRGMRDRAELFGGTMRIDSDVGVGTRIEVAVPR